MNNLDNNILLSPCCKAELQQKEQLLACTTCKGLFEIKNQIPLFAPDVYWGKAPEKIMYDALETIKKFGWGKFYSIFGGKFDFTETTDRADWRFTIPLRADWTILDIGAGMGRNTLPLARVAKQVVAFDTSFVRVRYIQELAKKNDLQNISMFVGDIFNLPLKENSFDLIVMNGVLEWVGLTKKFPNPREAQKEALKICRKLLKPGGYLYVGIENRLSYVYLKARDHGGLYYTNFLPRPIASLYSKIVKKEPYKTYTYNKNGYQKLFREGGFNPEFYLVYPGYNLPRIIIPYERIDLLQYMLQTVAPNTKRSRMLKKLSEYKIFLFLLRYHFYTFNIIAKK